MATGDLLMWATTLGLLLGIVWSLRYIVILDRKIDRILKVVEHEERTELKKMSVRKKKKSTRKKR